MSDLRVKLILEAIDRMTSPVRRMGGAVRSTLSSITRGFMEVNRQVRALGKGMTEFGKAVTFKISAPLAGLGLLAIKRAADFEDFRATLETATGSADAASDAWERVSKFATTTPFQLEEVLQAFIKLKNLGLDPSEEALTSYGNTASSMGKTLDQFIEAVADASTGEFERLKEFGIKASVNGKKVAFTFRGVRTVIKNNADDIQKYLKAIGDNNFAGAMEKKMLGLKGVWSNFQDTVSKILAEFGDDIVKTLDVKKLINDTATSLRGLLDAFKSLPAPMQNFIIKGGLILAILGPVIMAFGQLVLAIGFASTGFTMLAAAMGKTVVFIVAKMIPSLFAASAAFVRLGLAMLATPFGLILAGIAAIAGAFYVFYNWDEISAYWSGLWQGIQDTVASAVDYMRPLIDWVGGAIGMVSDGIGTLKNAITDNALTRTVSGYWNGGQSVSSFSDAAVPATPAKQSFNAGGTLNIKIDAEGRHKVVENRPKANSMVFNVVDTGPVMGGAY